MTTQATSALQMARECIAAIINQDDTLTVQEAREHASQALTCIERAEAAIDAMREVLKQVNDYFEQALQRRPPLNPLRDKIRAALALANGNRER